MEDEEEDDEDDVAGVVMDLDWRGLADMLEAVGKSGHNDDATQQSTQQPTVTESTRGDATAQTASSSEKWAAITSQPQQPPPPSAPNNCAVRLTAMLSGCPIYAAFACVMLGCCIVGVLRFGFWLLVLVIWFDFRGRLCFSAFAAHISMLVQQSVAAAATHFNSFTIK